jgi:hypothetical protein
MMKAVENIFYAFGGVTPYAVFDNLKGAVTRAHIYDPEVNKGFCQFANHWGFAVLPARPYRPQDKGSVERAIGVIQQGFFNEVRNRVFYSLRELNEALWDYLRKLNQAPMKDWGVSRDERFENEKALLKPLPQSPYEISEWRSAKVHPDCHIQVDKRFYSVPFKWVGKTVQVRLSQSRVEIFSEESEPLAKLTFNMSKPVLFITSFMEVGPCLRLLCEKRIRSIYTTCNQKITHNERRKKDGKRANKLHELQA